MKLSMGSFNVFVECTNENISLKNVTVEFSGFKKYKSIFVGNFKNKREVIKFIFECVDEMITEIEEDFKKGIVPEMGGVIGGKYEIADKIQLP